MHLCRVTDLHAIPVGEFNDLQILLWRGECVFDACHEVNWAHFHEDIKRMRREILKSGVATSMADDPERAVASPLPAIPEEYVGEELCPGIEPLAVGGYGAVSPAIVSYNWTLLPVWARVLQYTSDADLCRAVETCRSIQGESWICF